MMKAFSFKAKKKFLPVEMPDGSEITLPGPKKKIMDALSTLGEAGKEEAVSVDQIYEVIAMVLSTNLEGKSFTAGDVDELLEVTDVYDFMQAYNAFVQGATEGKN